MSNTVATSLKANGLEPLRSKSGWIVTLGIIYVVAGLIALGSVLMATVVTVFVVGVMMLIAGVAEVISAFQIKTWGKFLFWLLLGVLYIVAGFVTFENPLLAAALLTLLLAFSLIASGIMRIVLAFGMKEVLVDLGSAVRCHHSPAWFGDSLALACIGPVHSWTLPGYRSCDCRRGLDWRRAWLEKTHLANGCERHVAVLPLHLFTRNSVGHTSRAEQMSQVFSF